MKPETPTNLARAFCDSARRHPEKTALFWGDDEYSYHDLLLKSHYVAHRLAGEFNVKPGDRVGIWLKNCPEFVPALFGILETGAVVVPVNHFLKAAEVHFILEDAGIQVLVTDDTMQEELAKLRVNLPELRSLRAESISASVTEPASLGATESHAAGVLVAPSSLAVIIYTSGTTGRPKGAMLTHQNLLANLHSCRRVLEAVGEDRFVILLPMFHSFMLTVGILLPLSVGGSIVLVKSIHPAKNVLQEIVRHRATLLPAVPQFFRTMTSVASTTDLPLRICISGAAPLPGEILKEFTAKFPFPLLEGYGLSEASPVVSFNPIRGPWKAGSIGVPIYDVEVSVQNDAGQILGPGETGEICVRGQNVMLGYWNQPEETAKAFRRDWLLTGDIGHRDHDGYFFITDRKKDMLLVNGINVYPREIEEALYQFPGVREAAVIGVPSARKGEQPLAFASAAEGVALQEGALLQHLRERLANYKLPRRIIILPALPRTATGKVLKTDLRQWMASQPAAEDPAD
jgi:long-chain acyl-CoA synthetase